MCSAQVFSKLLVLVQSLLLLETCWGFHGNLSQISRRIYEGDEADDAQFPYQVSLRVGNYTCSGSIIDEAWIITAAHCFDKWQPSKEIAFLAGSLASIFAFDRDANVRNEEPEAQRISVRSADVILHQDYDGITLENDVALMYLRKPLVLSEVVNTIALPRPFEEPTGAVRASGWGQTEARNARGVNLRFTDKLNILNRDDCEEEWNGDIFESQICTEPQEDSPFDDVCAGDSGAPLTNIPLDEDEEPTLYGIVTFGSDCSDKRYERPAVYTSVSHFLDWIDENIERRNY